MDTDYFHCEKCDSVFRPVELMRVDDLKSDVQERLLAAGANRFDFVGTRVDDSTIVLHHCDLEVPCNGPVRCKVVIVEDVALEL